ncbi:hypothetical protein AB1Y20_018824 [Prymnesium parvum]|uniref:CS domain-containing protein n=1 Tax=Prymnesium parvum TaxID=97485 RepID=A0AB34JPQ4_PRYPA
MAEARLEQSSAPPTNPLTSREHMDAVALTIAGEFKTWLEAQLEHSPFKGAELRVDPPSVRELQGTTIGCSVFLPSGLALALTAQTPTTARVARPSQGSAAPPPCHGSGDAPTEHAEAAASPEGEPPAPSRKEPLEPVLSGNLEVVRGPEAAVPGGARYRWAQTYEEIGISTAMPAGLSAREMTVVFQTRQVVIHPKRSTAAHPIFALTPLCDIIPSGCSWTVEDGWCVQIVMEKARVGLFWRCVSEGHGPDAKLPSWWPHVV